MTKVTPFLMFDDQLEAAVQFYAATFPGSEVKNLSRAGKDGLVVSTEFVVRAGCRSRRASRDVSPCSTSPSRRDGVTNRNHRYSPPSCRPMTST